MELAARLDLDRLHDHRAAAGFGAPGCDSTTVGLSGVTSATTGRSVDLGSSAAVTCCLDVATVPSAAFERSVRS